MGKKFIHSVLVGILFLASSCVNSDEEETPDRGSEQNKSDTDSKDESVSSEDSDSDEGDPQEETEPVEVNSKVTKEALDYNWFVIGVDGDDTLNVRSSPGVSSEILAELDNWQGEFKVLDELQSTGSEKWRSVELVDGTTGWVNQKFLFAQPKTLSKSERSDMVAAAESFVSDAVASNPTQVADRGIWVRSLSSWHRFETWNDTAVINEAPVPLDETECDLEPNICLQPIFGFVGLDQVTENTTFLDDSATTWSAPGYVSSIGPDDSVHWVQVYSPGKQELDWQYTYVVFDWSTGKALVAGMDNYFWTP